MSNVVLAAAHHRLASMHPLLLGNGRVSRLHTHLLLQAADEHRRGNLDGRGTLTHTSLVEWIGYTPDICVDQLAFMARQLNVQGMRGRIHAALAYGVAVVRSGVRVEALNALQDLFATQAELGHADFKQDERFRSGAVGLPVVKARRPG